MILATRYAGNRELRSAEFGPSTVPNILDYARLASSGVQVTTEAAAGLPAVSAAIFLAAETLASMSLIVYQGEGGNRERARDTWQWSLLHDRPSREQSPYDLVFDLEVSLESCGNGLAQKIRSGGRVTELVPLDPDNAMIYRDRKTGEKRFDIWDGSSVHKGLTSADIFHVRGATLKGGGIAGVSPIHLHRDPLGAALAQERFAGAFFRNNASSGVTLILPLTSRSEAEAWGTAWKAQHQGLENAHKVGVLPKDSDIKSFPISLSDAQFIEGRRHSVEEIARIFRIVPPSLLGVTVMTGTQAQSQDDIERFTKFSMLHRMRRFELALKADPDLFGAGDMYPEFLAEMLLRPDYVTRVRGHLAARQGGWTTANEIRATENLPARPDGDQLQETPVGGAPNPRSLDEEAEMRTRRDEREQASPEVHLHLPSDLQVEMRQEPIVIPAPVVNVEAPQVIVNVPEQPAPVVNVEPTIVHVEVQPTPVEVNVEAPSVTVEAPNVLVEPKLEQGEREVVFERDRDGRLKKAKVK